MVVPGSWVDLPVMITQPRNYGSLTYNARFQSSEHITDALLSCFLKFMASVLVPINSSDLPLYHNPISSFRYWRRIYESFLPFAPWPCPLCFSLSGAPDVLGPPSAASPVELISWFAGLNSSGFDFPFPWTYVSSGSMLLASQLQALILPVSPCFEKQFLSIK